MNRKALIALATEAARDPSRASKVAAWIADELRAQQQAGETATPEGYLYQGAHEWLIQADSLVVEPLTGGPPITSSTNPYIPLRTPFDALIIGVSGWALPAPVAESNTQAFLAANLASADDGRDLFSVSIGVDGQASFGTDGNDQLMFPASTVVGTRLNPRAMAWTVRRNQIIQAKFRNITNLYLDGVSSEVMPQLELQTAAICFTVLNLGSP